MYFVARLSHQSCGCGCALRCCTPLYWDRRVSVVVADVVAARLLSAQGGEDVPAHAMHRGILDEARVMGLLQPHIPQASAMGSVRHDEVTASAP